MKTKKYEIYDYWKDRAITKGFEVKLWKKCTLEDEAVKIVNFPDEVVCWACGKLPWTTADTEDIKTLWNKDRLLERAHILAHSKGGEDTPANLFLLCPDCHLEAPDTTSAANFYAWVYYKRTSENWIQCYKKELERAAEIRGIGLEELAARFGRLDWDINKVKMMQEQLQEKCATHGINVVMSSKMLSMIDLVLENTKEN